MAKCTIKMNEEQCKDFIDRIFMQTLGVDFDYAVQAVKEKLERDNNPPRVAQTNVI